MTRPLQPLPERLFEKIVTDKGYHGNQSCRDLQELGLPDIPLRAGTRAAAWKKNETPSPENGLRQPARVRESGQAAAKRMRGERVERSNAHL